MCTGWAGKSCPASSLSDDHLHVFVPRRWFDNLEILVPANKPEGVSTHLSSDSLSRRVSRCRMRLVWNSVVLYPVPFTQIVSACQERRQQRFCWMWTSFRARAQLQHVKIGLCFESEGPLGLCLANGVSTPVDKEWPLLVVLKSSFDLEKTW